MIHGTSLEALLTEALKSWDTKLGLRLFRVFQDLTPDQKLVVIDLAESLSKRASRVTSSEKSRPDRRSTNPS